MKRIIQQEKIEFVNDFTGEVLKHGAPVTLTMEFSYGSSRDGDRIELHFGDEHVEMFMEMIRNHRKLGKMLE